VHRDIKDENVILGFIGGGFLRADRAIEAALGGIIFQEISQIIGRHDIADRDHFNIFPDQALFDHRPKDQTTNAAEPINCNFHSHITISVSISIFVQM